MYDTVYPYRNILCISNASIRTQCNATYLDGKGMADRHLSIGFVVAVVQNIGIGVKGLTNSVTAKVAHRGKAPGHNVIFNNGSNILVVVAGLHKLTGRNPRVVRCLDQGLGLVVGFSCHEHFTTVSVKAVQVYGNVQIDNVSFLQGSIVGNAVTNHFVDGCAAGFGKAVIIQGRRIRSSLFVLNRKENGVSECVLYSQIKHRIFVPPRLRR
jgi:hypothetical protein